MNHTRARVTKTSFNKTEKMIERLLEGVLEKLVGKIEMFFFTCEKMSNLLEITLPFLSYFYKKQQEEKVF